MSFALFFMAVVSLSLLLFGMIRPKSVLPLQMQPTRGKVAAVYIVLTVLLFVLGGVLSENKVPPGTASTSTKRAGKESPSTSPPKSIQGKKQTTPREKEEIARQARELAKLTAPEGPCKYSKVDFEGSMEDEKCQKAIGHLEEIALLLRILGSYPKGEEVDGQIHVRT